MHVRARAHTRARMGPGLTQAWDPGSVPAMHCVPGRVPLKPSAWRRNGRRGWRARVVDSGGEAPVVTRRAVAQGVSSLAGWGGHQTPDSAQSLHPPPAVPPHTPHPRSEEKVRHVFITHPDDACSSGIEAGPAPWGLLAYGLRSLESRSPPTPSHFNTVGQGRLTPFATFCSAQDQPAPRPPGGRTPGLVTI